MVCHKIIIILRFIKRLNNFYYLIAIYEKHGLNTAESVYNHKYLNEVTRILSIPIQSPDASRSTNCNQSDDSKSLI